MSSRRGKGQNDLLALGLKRPEPGVVLGSIDAEILEVLPEGFVFQYTALWLQGAGISVGGVPGLGKVVEPNVVAKARRVTRVSTNQTETRGGAKQSRSDSVGGVDFANEAYVNYRRRVDGKLRKLAREIRSFRGDRVKAGVRRCSACKRFGDDEWVYCPWDGQRMEEVDR